MLQTNTISGTTVDSYGQYCRTPVLKETAAGLEGSRVLLLSATSQGGGVAEMLRSEIALLKGLGLDVTWQTIDPPPRFFDVTKKIHNGLQGESAGISAAEWNRYESISRDLAGEIDPDDWDLILVHDPQPAGARGFIRSVGQAKWVWRCHLDLSAPDPAVAKRFVRYLSDYDAAIYSMKQYRVPGFRPAREAIIAPVIDPLAPKNEPMPKTEARERVTKYGISSDKPLLTQVSRFDRWKDPVGVISAWQLACREVPELQLALVGNTVNDDPEATEVLAEVRQAADGTSNIFIVDNVPPAENDRTVKAFYVASDVVMQKSLREGFGLTVSEALWSGTPVVATQVGGIVRQVESGVSGYLTSTIDGAADAVVKLVKDPKLAKRMGAAGKAHVRKHFLLPRLVEDELRFLAEVLG